MNYTIVEIEEKIVVGVGDTVEFTAPDFGEKLGKLWCQLYVNEGGVHGSIKNKVNQHAIGAYTDYFKTGFYALAGNEVSSAENPELKSVVIPKGKYAKFECRDIKATKIGDEWMKIMALGLEHTASVDFEEYLNEDMEHANVDIYLGIK